MENLERINNYLFINLIYQKANNTQNTQVGNYDLFLTATLLDGTKLNSEIIKIQVK